MPVVTWLVIGLVCYVVVMRLAYRFHQRLDAPFKMRVEDFLPAILFCALGPISILLVVFFYFMMRDK